MIDWIQATPLATAAGWLITWTIHSTVLLAVAWGLSRLLRGRRLALEESIWRLAIVGSLVTASLQIGAGLEPLTARWTIAPSTAAAVDTQRPTGELTALPRVTVNLPAAPAEGSLPATALSAAAPAAALSGEQRLQTAGVFPVAPAAAPEGVRRHRWAAPLLALWLCGALLACLPLALAGLRLSHHLHRRQPVRLGPAAETLKRLLRRPEVPRRTRLSATPRLAVPIALGFVRPEICLPERAQELDGAQQASLVAHETAHLVRHDPLWLLTMRSLEGVFFFQPLLRVARRRLEEIAEFRCDDWARQQTGQPSALARCLTAVAGWSVGEAATVPAPGMVGRPSGLSRRIERLLDRDANADRPSRWLLAGGIAAVLLAVLALPAVTLTAKAGADDAPPAAERQEPGESAESVAGGDPAGDANGGWVVEGEDGEDWMAAQEEREARDVDEGWDDSWDEDLTDEDLVDSWGDHDWGDFEFQMEGFEGLAALEALHDLQIEGLENLEGLEEIAVELSTLDFSALEDLGRRFEGMDIGDLYRSLEDLETDDFHHFEALTDWSQDFAEDWQELAQEMTHDLEELQHVGDHAGWDDAASAELHARIADIVAASMPDQETIERLAEEGRRLAERSRPDQAEIDRLVAEARRLAEVERPSDAEIERLRQQAREIAERSRPTEEELERLREEARRLAARHRPNPDELERLRAEARELAERHRPIPEELERLRTEAREHAERHRQEIERSRERHREARDRAAEGRARARAEQERRLAAERSELEQRRRELEERERTLREAERRLEEAFEEDG
ncbi:MAG: M56 family metallopeptidase [Acidobacteriota bacterium]